MQDWIAGQHGHIVKLLFTAFMKEIHSKYLPSDWKPKVPIYILSANFNYKKQMFWDFALYLQKQNFLLLDTLSYFELYKLYTQIKAKLDFILFIIYFKRKLDATINFYKWLNSIWLINKAQHQIEKCIWEIADEVFRQSKKSLLSSTKINTCASESTSSTEKSVCFSSLTIEKKCLLKDNSSCFYCCCPFVSCQTCI